MNGSPAGQSLSLPSVAIERTRFNPPGQSQLTYGGGAFLPTLDRMLIRLARQSVPGPDGAPALMPFAHFNLDSGDDWTLALLHAWAAVTDVLGFYHERIVNEGYLRTATERLSVVQLARTVGYELQPGLAASAMLALTVVQGLGEPPQTVFVPKGTAVQSVPPPKSGLHQGTPSSTLPQIFETSDDLVARSEWNLLRPAALGELTWEHRMMPGVNSLRLLGNRTDLKKGERLLFVGQDPDNPQRTLWRMAQVTSTTPNVPKGFTVITWESAPGMPADPLPYPGPYPETDTRHQRTALASRPLPRPSPPRSSSSCARSPSSSPMPRPASTGIGRRRRRPARLQRRPLRTRSPSGGPPGSGCLTSRSN